MRRGRRVGSGRLSNLGQGSLGLGVAESEVERPRGRSDFVDDDPRTIFIGGKRLDRVLEEKGFGWVLRMRSLMESLDYSLLTCRYSRLGRKPYHPRTVLSLILFGALTRHFSLRDLEELSAVHVGAWWLCGGNEIDHSTIGKFIVLHQEALSDEFFVALTARILKELGIKSGVTGIDGTVMEAASSRFSALRAEAVSALAAEAKERAAAEPGDAEAQREAAEAAAREKVLEERQAQRESQRKDASTVSVVATEPEAVVQPRKDGAQRPGYKVSAMAHEEGFVVGQHCDPSSETAAVPALIDQHRTIFDGEVPPTMLGDTAYFCVSTLRETTEQGIDFLCPAGQTFECSGAWEKKPGHELFPKTAFEYDEERNVYRCPAGEILDRVGKGRDRNLEYRQYGTVRCAGCALRSQCTRSKHGRRIKRYEGEEYKEGMRQVLANPRARRMYRKRMCIVEPVFAVFREHFGFRRFRRRGLSGVRAETGLYSMAFNVKRALTHRAAASTRWGRALARTEALWGPFTRSTALRALLIALRVTRGAWRPWTPRLTIEAGLRPAH